MMTALLSVEKLFFNKGYDVKIVLIEDQIIPYVPRDLISVTSRAEVLMKQTWPHDGAKLRVKNRWSCNSQLVSCREI